MKMFTGVSAHKVITLRAYFDIRSWLPVPAGQSVINIDLISNLICSKHHKI